VSADVSLSVRHVDIPSILEAENSRELNREKG
jgi:hypothetical protein